MNVDRIYRYNSWRIYAVAIGAALLTGALCGVIYPYFEEWVYSLPLLLALLPPLLLAYLLGKPAGLLLATVARRVQYFDAETLVMAALLAGLLILPAIRLTQYCLVLHPQALAQATLLRATEPTWSDGARLLTSWQTAMQAHPFHEFLVGKITAFPDAIDPNGILLSHTTFGWLFWFLRLVLCCVSCLGIPLALLTSLRAGEEHPHSAG